jgi:hypothetical protein
VEKPAIPAPFISSDWGNKSGCIFQPRPQRKKREPHRLTAREVSNAKPKHGLDAMLLADGGNLYLQVTRGDSDHVRRSWLFR